jgi:citrate lyase subunit beta-like protein
VVTAGVAAKIPSLIDLVHTQYGNAEALRGEALDGKGLGFNGKQVIHPSQIKPVQEVFSPSGEEITWAVRIVIAAEKADAMGKGSWGLDGTMIDAPVIGKAHAIIERARLCVIDIAEHREAWKGQAPD